ncbi:hypothetical protein EVAR_101712_1 [Eumeta japonica]|uniref:Uncharacterized protein n=1 Tax=Eumeta variegata TaxID=151549 RepID=A0A4C1TLF6_EUMVA|nr:hypothetical protein EVAR_101712_1 [Eumeta japonica]
MAKDEGDLMDVVSVKTLLANVSLKAQKVDLPLAFRHIIQQITTNKIRNKQATDIPRKQFVKVPWAPPEFRSRRIRKVPTSGGNSALPSSKNCGQYANNSPVSKRIPKNNLTIDPIRDWCFGHDTYLIKAQSAKAEPD